jgi:hypothetical protein
MTPDELLLYFGAIIILMLALVVGRLMDPAYRCNMLRRFTKKPYIMAKLFAKDARLVNSHVINAFADSLWIGSAYWTFLAGSVMIERKNSDGKLERDKEAGFKITSAMLRTDEGCPTLYLDVDTMRPLKIWKPDEGADTKPDEIGSTMLAWDSNQALKRTRGAGNPMIWTIVLMIIVVCCLFISWDADQKANIAASNTAKILSYMNQSGAIVPGQGGTMNIVQPKG